MKFKNFFHWPALLVIGLLLFPLIMFLFHLGMLCWPKGVEWLSSLFWTFIQASLSTGVVLLLALFGSRGLLWSYKKSWYFLLEGLCLVPCLIPSLLLVVSLIHITDWFIPFPFGLGALIFVQILTYTGLATVALSRVLVKEASALSEWAFLHGASTWLLLRVLAQTLLRKDIKTLAVLIFVSAWTSLSLPLLTAGGASISLEFYIYKQLQDPNLWPQAGALILLQTLFVFLLCLKGFSGKASFSLQKKAVPPLLPSPFFILIPLLPVVFSLGGLFFIPNRKVITDFSQLTPLLVSAGKTSLLLGFGVGGLTFGGLILMALSFSNIFGRKFVTSYLNPGTSLTGFAFLLIPFASGPWIELKWIAGLTLLTFPFIYRFRGELSLEKLTSQVETARLCGADWGLMFRDILWPQCRGAFCLCAGLAGFWAAGDFAYTLIVSQGKWNLALVVYDLFSSYRLELAILGSWLLLGICFLILLFWIGVGYVLDKKIILYR
ncbi:MAG: hypothetical protein OXB86_06695 [Bdellovibrionales bacterium]|nr:hypothetical protein [Bdellovibrionales bacterium]